MYIEVHDRWRLNSQQSQNFKGEEYRCFINDIPEKIHMPIIPEQLEKNIINIHGKNGKEWLADLPLLLIKERVRNNY